MKLVRGFSACALSLALLAAAAPRAALARALTNSPAWDQAFVLYGDERGEAACRDASEPERASIIAAAASAPAARLIYEGAPRRRPGSDATKAPTFQNTSGAALQQSAGLRIVLHGTSQLEQNPAARDAFIVAANRWEALISTPITVVIDVDYGPKFFGQDYPGPSIIGQTGTARLRDVQISSARQALIERGGSASELELYNAIPSPLPVETASGQSTVSTMDINRALARALGLSPDITNPDSLATGQADAGIGFNSNFGTGGGFDFDPSDGITSGQTDFDAVATHEIGHALGFSSNSGSASTANPQMWDLYRFRPGAASASSFATAPRVMVVGGSFSPGQVFFGDRTSTYSTRELELSTGGPDGSTANNADGRQSSHWKDDAATGRYIGIMDPTIGAGRRKTITENDVAAADLLGYSVSFTPPARPANDNFANAALLAGASGAVSGSNVGATREPNEPPESFPGDKSVWYRWVAPEMGTATFETTGSNFDTTLSVFMDRFTDENVITRLLNIEANNDIDSSTRQSRLTFTTNVNQTYWVCVNGVGGESGSVALRWNFTAAPPTRPTFQFAAYAFRAAESDGAAALVILRSGETDTPQTVFYSTTSGTAAPGSDYVRTESQVNFAPGETYKVALVPLVNDNAAEPEETVSVNITATGPNAGLGPRGQTTLHILDDDSFPANSVGFEAPLARTVSEGAGKIDLAVVRSGDVSQPATVTYRTAGGNALPTRHYTAASGTLRFAAGESSKTVTVLITQNGLAEGARDFNVELGQAAGTAVGGAGAAVHVTVTDDDAQDGPNPSDASASYVTQHYVDFLNREPDASGLAFWTNEIEKCGDDRQCREVRRVNVSAAFFLSIEFQETGFLVYRAYRAAFGNMPNAPVPLTLQEFLSDTRGISGGVRVGVGDWRTQLENNKRAFFDEFVTRPRFRTVLPAGLMPSQFVDTLNANTGLALSRPERDALVSQLTLDNTDAGRAYVLRQVAENANVRAGQLDRAFVLMQYFGYMRRNPNDSPDSDFSGFAFWFDKLEAFRGNYIAAEMVKAFIFSDEYRKRFGR